jgi:hypothetical protein
MAAYTSPALKILEEKKKQINSRTDLLPSQKKSMIDMIDAEINQTQTSEAQEWFKLAEGPGMDPVSLSGLGRSGISYADPYPGDPSDRFPKAPTKEEEEYRLALRGPVPGMMTYRGWT